jgi:hypothetical protein
MRLFSLENSMNEVTVKAIRPFEGDEGFKNSDSKPFTVTRQRFADLKANGLVEEVSEKSAPAPENKMETATANKAAAAPKNK